MDKPLSETQKVAMDKVAKEYARKLFRKSLKSLRRQQLYYNMTGEKNPMLDLMVEDICKKNKV